MHGFNNSRHYLQHLCLSNDIIFIQEHWLMSSKLCDFNDIDKDFNFYGCSAMDNVCEMGLVRGRPFGGVGVLYRRSLSSHLASFSHCSGSRFISVATNIDDLRLLCFGAYFPCDDGSQEYPISLSTMFGYIEHIIDSHVGNSCMILGDFNFTCL